MKNISFYLLVVILVSCSIMEEDQSIQKVEQVENQLQEIANNEAYSGTVLIAQKGEILFEKAYGYANLSHKVPNTIETKFGTASMGKMFTAVAVMKLREQGKLDLDTKVGEILKDYPNAVVRDSVTVEQLLMHTSGLTDFFNDEFEFRAKHTVRTLADYFDLFKENDLLFAPGTGFSYSNAGYIVLGMLIEELSGMNFYDYVKQHIFIPAGMENTDYYETDTSIENLAQGYISKNEQGIWRTNTYMRGARGSSAGGAYSNAHDLLAFALALQNHQLISKESLSLMVSDENADGYGIGFRLNTFNNIEVYGHNGGAHGVSAELDIYKNLDFVVVTMSNRGPLDGWVDVRSIIRETLAGSTKETDKYLGSKELIEIYEAHGLDSALTKLATLEENISDKYLLDVANKYRESKEFNKAIDLMSILITGIPDSWYCYSILADIHFDAGNKEMAIENYHKSLALDPKNEWAIEKLEMLEK